MTSGGNAHEALGSSSSLCNLMMWQGNVACSTPEKIHTSTLEQPDGEDGASTAEKELNPRVHGSKGLARLGRSTQARNAGWPGRFNARQSPSSRMEKNLTCSNHLTDCNNLRSVFVNLYSYANGS